MAFRSKEKKKKEKKKHNINQRILSRWYEIIFFVCFLKV